jgi:hypothetical protein
MFRPSLDGNRQKSTSFIAGTGIGFFCEKSQIHATRPNRWDTLQPSIERILMATSTDALNLRENVSRRERGREGQN